MSIPREKSRETVAVALPVTVLMAVPIACCWFAVRAANCACSVMPDFKARLRFLIAD